MSAVSLNEPKNLGGRELLEILLSPNIKRKLALRRLSNEELFRLYGSELVLGLHNTKDLTDTQRMLARFGQYLGEYPPSLLLAKSFLGQFTSLKPRSQARYTKMVRAFLKWYGEPVKGLAVKIPKSLPPYTEDSEVERLFKAAEVKQTQRKLIARDQLLLEVALKTGLRRGEIASLQKRDIHADFLIVRCGKGSKDRMVPLAPSLAMRLDKFVRDRKPEDRVFGLKASSVTMQVKKIARKAGLEELHAHSLRHKFAQDLLERDVDVRTVEALLGHENLNTTQLYLSVTDKKLHEAINRLEKPDKEHKPAKQPLTPQMMPMPQVQPRWKHSWELPENQAPSMQDKACYLTAFITRNWQTRMSEIPILKIPRATD